MKKASFKFLGRIDGKFWVALWSFAALVRFCLGLTVDPVFLGVLGLYTGHRIAGKFGKRDETDED